MPLFACGVNHKTAPLALREQLAYASDQLAVQLYELRTVQQVQEAALISTCNRTEWYTIAPSIQPINDWLQHKHGDLSPYLYIHQEQSAVQHLLRVASGLDSMVVGEAQILGQIKAAFQQACSAGTIGSYLQRLFQHVFRVTKHVRTDTAIGVNPVSIASTAVHLAKQIFANLTQRQALLIGAGATIELAARHLRAQGIGQIIFINRTLAKAEYLAQQYAGCAYTLAELPLHLHKADILIAATSSTLPLLGKGSVESALKLRKHQPMLMLDLALPRDIEPEVAQLQDAYLYNVDDLHAIIAKSMQGRQTAAEQAEQIIELQAVHFMRNIRALDAVATIRACRAKLNEFSAAEVSKAKRLLERGMPPEEALLYLARMLRNKFIHQPSVQLRQAASEGRADLLALAQQLFDLAEL